MSTPLLTINQLSAASTIVGTELTPVFQNNNTFSTNINSIVDYASARITPPINSEIQTLSGNVFAAINLRLPLAGGTMTGFITAHADPTLPLHVATKRYVDAADALRVTLSGDAMTGFLSAQSPVRPVEVAIKQYVDSLFATSTAAAVELIRGAKASRFLYGFNFEGGAVSQGTRGKFFYNDGLNRLRMSGRDGEERLYYQYNGGGCGQAYGTTYNAYSNNVVPIQMQTNEYAISAVGVGAASFVLTNRGNIYSTGSNAFRLADGTSVLKGFLGLNDTTTQYYYTWQKIPSSFFNDASATQIAVSEATLFASLPRSLVGAVATNGKGYAWGSNNFNQILDANTDAVAYPAVLSGGSVGQTNIKQVLPATCAMFVIDADNKVHVRGNGSYAEYFAQNTNSNITNFATFSACYFTPFGGSATLGMQADRLYINGSVGNGVMADTGRNYSHATIFALTGGKIWAAGHNTGGECAQLTSTSTISTFKPVLSGTGAPLMGNFTAIYPSWAGGVLAVEDNGRTWGWGNRKSIGIPGTGTYTTSASIVPSLSDYKVKKIINASCQINAGSPVSVAITTDGKVFATGSNKFGGNGQGTVTPTGAGSSTWLQVILPASVSAIDVNFCGDVFVTSDDGDDDAFISLAPGIHLLTTDSPEKTLYDIYSFGSNAGYMLGINQSANAAIGRNIISLPVKVSINL